MKTLIFLSVCLLLLISQVSAVTLSGSVRYNETVTAGQDYFFDMLLKPDPTEKEVYFEKIETTGDCSDWVAVNRSGTMRFNTSQAVRADLMIPKDAENRMYRCDIAFVGGGSSGMLQYALGVPISLNVTGGIEATPTPTTAPTTTTTAPTTTIQTTTKPTPKTTYTPLSLWVPIAGLGLIPLIRRRI